jgi:hypothetical protein
MHIMQYRYVRPHLEFAAAAWSPWQTVKTEKTVIRENEKRNVILFGLMAKSGSVS